MPRYFFHFTNGRQTFTDSTGVELPGVAAATARDTANSPVAQRDARRKAAKLVGLEDRCGR